MYPTQLQLENYAEIAVKVGANVQQGQTVVVMAPITSAPLVRLIASKAYEVGAKNVHVEYNDEELSRIKFKQAPEEAFSQYPMFRAKAWEDFVEEGASFISIYSPNPDLLNDVDPTRVATASKTASTALKNYRSALMNHTNAWTLLSYPTPEWANKVFPNSTQEEAIQKLWERIIDATRISHENPVQAWRDHNARLLEMVNVLNDKRYKQLQYEAPGTKLTVDLPDGHIWLGGSKANSKGIYFNPNLPTEEVFTMPHKDGVNGVVSSTKPLNYNGQVIDGFTLTFENGKVTTFTAERGYEALNNLLNTDESARQLGKLRLFLMTRQFLIPMSFSLILYMMKMPHAIWH